MIESAAPRTRRPSSTGKRIVVMQPYLFPYAGYFRLFAEADEFVIFDCVQFPRRGRVHRCEVADAGSGRQWLTLPLANQPREVLIRDLQFATDARRQFDARLEQVSGLRASKGAAAERVREFLYMPMAGVVDYLEAGLTLVNELLGISTPVTRSSELGLPPELRGQDRVLAVAKARGAMTYVNSPGGRSLYDEAAFARAGIGLEFLPPYQGPYLKMLPALLESDPELIRKDLGLG